ncbi:MAG: response regulator transcription factor [Chromatiales bacterium]|mgnify:FL=1|jgi:DNA-binding NarL/FixJ family response regulator
MKLLTIDDHALFRQGLKFLLTDLQNDLECIEAESLAEALALEDKKSIEFILLDYHLRDSKGEESLKRISEAFENAVIVVLSGEENPQLIRSIIDHGAAGFIPKSSTQDILIAALKLILAGGVYIPAIAVNASPTAPDTPSVTTESLEEGINTLSQRQLEVLRRAVQGKSNKVIARELFIAEGTVKAHLSAAFRALGVSNRTEAVYAASRLNLVKM